MLKVTIRVRDETGKPTKNKEKHRFLKIGIIWDFYSLQLFYLCIYRSNKINGLIKIRKFIKQIVKYTVNLKFLINFAQEGREGTLDCKLYWYPKFYK